MYKQRAEASENVSKGKDLLPGLTLPGWLACVLKVRPGFLFINRAVAIRPRSTQNCQLSAGF